MSKLRRVRTPKNSEVPNQVNRPPRIWSPEPYGDLSLSPAPRGPTKRASSPLRHNSGNMREMSYHKQPIDDFARLQNGMPGHFNQSTLENTRHVDVYRKHESPPRYNSEDRLLEPDYLKNTRNCIHNNARSYVMSGKEVDVRNGGGDRFHSGDNGRRDIAVRELEGSISREGWGSLQRHDLLVDRGHVFPDLQHQQRFDDNRRFIPRHGEEIRHDLPERHDRENNMRRSSRPLTPPGYENRRSLSRPRFREGRSVSPQVRRHLRESPPQLRNSSPYHHDQSSRPYYDPSFKEYQDPCRCSPQRKDHHEGSPPRKRPDRRPSPSRLRDESLGHRSRSPWPRDDCSPRRSVRGTPPRGYGLPPAQQRYPVQQSQDYPIRSNNASGRDFPIYPHSSVPNVDDRHSPRHASPMRRNKTVERRERSPVRFVKTEEELYHRCSNVVEINRSEAHSSRRRPDRNSVERHFQSGDEMRMSLEFRDRMRTDAIYREAVERHEGNIIRARFGKAVEYQERAVRVRAAELAREYVNYMQASQEVHRPPPLMHPLGNATHPQPLMMPFRPL